MLLDLFDWLAGYYGGFRVFGYLTLRAIFAALTALTIALMVGPWMIRTLAARQIGQVVRDCGPDQLAVQLHLWWQYPAGILGQKSDEHRTARQDLRGGISHEIPRH